MTQEADTRGKAKVREGLVVGASMNKTITVSIARQIKHPLYGKYIKRTRKCYAHDENNECGVGDLVQIMETRPLSKTKRWRLKAILTKAV